MLATAFFLLDVNLSFRGEPNFVSLAGKTLGKYGKAVTWVFYLLLLYALLAAYISACAPLFISTFSSLFSVSLSAYAAPFLLPLVFGGVIYLGTRGADYFNRILMVGLILSYIFLTGSLPSKVETERLLHNDFLASLVAVPVIITSFGYHIIIPTLTTYLEHKRSLLRKTLLIGSAIPFTVYMIWQWTVLGTVPLEALASSWQDGVPSTEPLSSFLGSSVIRITARFFSFFAVITSFLGVSLSLSDFLSDGLKIKKTRKGKLIALALTFVPPLLFIFSYKKSFYAALDYAGVFVAVLLGILPCLMVLRLKNQQKYQTVYAKCGIYLIILLCLGVIGINILEKRGIFDSVLLPYLQRIAS